MESAVDGILVIDADGIIQDFNPAAEKLFGYSANEAIGRNIRFLMPEPYRSQHDRYIKNHLTTGEKKIIGIGREVTGLRKDGTIFPMDLAVSKMVIDGKIYFTGIMHDIKHLKHTELALRQSEERLKRSQEFANIGTWDWNIRTGELYWSEMIGPLFGYPTGTLETTYENFLNAVHPEDCQAVVDAVNDCIEKGTEYNIEHRVIWPDGTVHWMLEQGDVIRGENGVPQHMLGVVQDITQRKRAEEELERQKTLFESVFRDVPDAMMLVNTERQIVMCNPAVESIFGYPETELIGRSISVLYHDLEDYRRQGEKRYHPQSSIEGNSYVVKYKKRDGGVFSGETVGGPIHDKQGSVIGYIGVIRDITERERTQQELLEAKELAERANQAKSQFLSNMSHELRTPLNAVLGFAQLLQADEKLNESQQDSVHEIIRAGNHLLELINEILDLARIETGNIQLRMESIPVPEIFTECESLTSTLAAKRNLNLDIELDGCEDMYVYADRMRLKQALLNLLSNAVKYNREGGTVAMYCDGSEELVRIYVRDTGYGISTEKQMELFKPFERLGAEHSGIEGTGIGLVITKNLVEMMGGELGFKTYLDEGTDFWLELSRFVEGEGKSDSTPSTDEKAYPVANSNLRPLKVLYIENNPANVRLIAKLLERHGYGELLHAGDAETGLQLASEHQPDLVLMDIGLPGINGTEALQQMRSRSETKHIPVFAVTANAMEDDIAAGLAAGFDKYLTKPLEIPVFLQALETLREQICSS